MPSRLIWSSSNYSIQYLDFWLWFTVLWFEDKEIMPYTLFQANPAPEPLQWRWSRRPHAQRETQTLAGPEQEAPDELSQMSKCDQGETSRTLQQ